jgi:ABC-2 type transport system ATP-binding protein
MLNKKSLLPLVINNLNKSFKNSLVLNDVSLEIMENEIFGLVGLNGIGKTTMIKIILNLLNQDSGEVSLFGRGNHDLEAKAKIAYLPEKFNPSPFLKGEEFLELSVGYYGLKYNREEAEALCLELDLPVSALKKRISAYSKGMGQKLGLISVFLTEGSLLILDEPMSGLDPNARIMLKRKLNSYKQRGKSIFFTSHILSDIEEICDRIGVIHNGKLLFVGTSKEFIKMHQGQNFEESFLKAIDTLI